MLDSIKKLFSSSQSKPKPAATEPGKDIRVAACALLLELANADEEFTQEEQQHLESAVQRQFGLDADEAESLLSKAQQARDEADDLWQFTNLVAENYSTGQKMVLAEMMWGVVYSDGELAGKEDYLMRRICSLLRLEPGYLAEAQKRISDEGGGNAEEG